MNPDAINYIFRDFDQKLYSLQIDPLDNNIYQFLSNISLPNLHHEQAMALDSPLSIGELNGAL